MENVKASEIRIGNYILLKKGENIEPYMVLPDDIEKIYDFGEDAFCMPVTEETMIEAGMGESTLFFIRHLPYKIKYVHQLQNLVFAITGDELELKF
jgi:hypothetical protein